MLAVRNLAVSYGDSPALWDISLEVSEGEIVALVGGNGAGKTTTLRAISGLMRPRSGSVRFRGEEIAGLPSHQIAARGIGHIPEGRLLFPEMTVLENLELGAYLRPARRLTAEGLEQVYTLFPLLRERRNQEVRTLSGGEQQMVAIGRALMGRPRLLLVDEPSLGLAPLLVEELFHAFQQINCQGISILLVEQDVRQALDIAHRGYVVEAGRISLAGTAQELRDHGDIRSAYMGL